MHSFSTSNINIHHYFSFLFHFVLFTFPCSATLKHQFICHRHLLFRCLFLCKFSIDSIIFRYYSMYFYVSNFVTFPIFHVWIWVLVVMVMLFFSSFDFISHTCSIFMSFFLINCIHFLRCRIFLSPFFCSFICISI